MTDEYAAYKKELDSPSGNFFNITPDDDNDLDITTRGISFGTAGAIKVLGADMEEPEIIPAGALAAGAIHALRIKKVFASDTDAEDIMGYA